MWIVPRLPPFVVAQSASKLAPPDNATKEAILPKNSRRSIALSFRGSLLKNNAALPAKKTPPLPLPA